MAQNVEQNGKSARKLRSKKKEKGSRQRTNGKAKAPTIGVKRKLEEEVPPQDDEETQIQEEDDVDDIVPDEEVAEQREARAQAEQQQQQQAMMLEVLKSGGGAIKDLASADLEGDNVASRTANILQEAAGNA